VKTIGKCPHCGKAITGGDLRVEGETGGKGGSGPRRRSTVDTIALAVGWLFLILAGIAVVPIALAIVVGVAAWLLHLAVFVFVVVILVVIVVKMVKWAAA